MTVTQSQPDHVVTSVENTDTQHYNNEHFNTQGICKTIQHNARIIELVPIKKIMF